MQCHANQSSFLPTSCHSRWGEDDGGLSDTGKKNQCKHKLLRDIRGHCRTANRDPGVGNHVRDRVCKIKEHAAHPRRKCSVRKPVADRSLKQEPRDTKKGLRETLGNALASKPFPPGLGQKVKET